MAKRLLEALGHEVSHQMRPPMTLDPDDTPQPGTGDSPRGVESLGYAQAVLGGGDYTRVQYVELGDTPFLCLGVAPSQQHTATTARCECPMCRAEREQAAGQQEA